MSFPGLDSYQQQNRTLPGKVKGLLPKVGEYLETELTRKKVDPSEPARAIVPYTLAKRLRIDEPTALTLLTIYEDAGVVKLSYNVLCPDTDSFLGSFKSYSELPPTILCPHHTPEKEHTKSEYFVDLVYRFTPEVTKDYSRRSKR